MTKRVFLLPPPALPVPAVRGGAVETLLTHLIEENERQTRLELHCASLPAPEAVARAAEWQHTQMHWIAPTTRVAQALWNPHRGWLTRRGTPAPHDPWYNKVGDAIRRTQPDAVVAEGGNLLEPQAIARAVGRDRMWAHLHMQLRATPQLEEMYGGVLAISQFVLDDWQPTRPARMQLVPNCVDTSLFCPAVGPEAEAECVALRTKLGLAPEDFAILFCGRICPEKGVMELVEALRELPDVAYKLIVVGSPFFDAQDESPFFDELRRAAQPLADAGRIVFTGFVPNGQLPGYYRAADLACFPAVWDEPAGITAIEGMACGCPVLATDSGGMPEYLAGSGALLLPRDVRLTSDGVREPMPGGHVPLARALAEAIAGLRAAPDRRAAMRAAGPVRAAAFSRAAYYEKFAEALGAD